MLVYVWVYNTHMREPVSTIDFGIYFVLIGDLGFIVISFVGIPLTLISVALLEYEAVRELFDRMEGDADGC